MLTYKKIDNPGGEEGVSFVIREIKLGKSKKICPLAIIKKEDYNPVIEEIIKTIVNYVNL